MAPPQHEIWGLYGVAASRIKGVKAHPDASCNACGKVLKMHNLRVTCLFHVLKCDKIDEDSKARWLRYDSLRRHPKAARLMTPARPGRNDARSAPSISKRLFRSPQSSSPRTSSRKRAWASVTSINQREEENFLRVAMGFIATGIPFRVIDDPHFRAMFDYKLPSRRQLSGRLLDMIFTREMDRIIALMCSVTEWALVTDGWSNVNGDNIINFVFVNPKFPPVFWKSINTKADAHTGRYIADTILSTIIELEAVVGAGVVTAVVTDNAVNMKNTWKLVRKERRGIVCTGCTAHGMNLLMKYIFKIKFFKDVLEKAQKLARFIKARRGLWSRFRDMQKQLKKKGEKRRRLSLTVATRWYTHEKCVANVVQNRDVIAALFAAKTFLKSYKGSDLEEATEFFIEEEFWQDASIAVDLIRPINSSLTAFERDDCSISLGYHQFEWLRTRDVYAKNIEECSKDLQQQVLSAIEKRQKKVCWNPLEIAHMLDQTKCMDGHDAKSVINAASKLANKLGLVEEDKKYILHKQLQEFVLEKCSWKGEQSVNNNRFSPLNWWSLPDDKYKLLQVDGCIEGIRSSVVCTR
ncbi:hypothetical protein PC123_g5322 [Phytophthora cactorum]|nr:hypothetical protein PC120_g4297 [Phytophthora cactorum]KAG4059750.1 hypothetical protein PC123_g5322 [Phytophthora cactorum]